VHKIGQGENKPRRWASALASLLTAAVGLPRGCGMWKPGRTSQSAGDRLVGDAPVCFSGVCLIAVVACLPHHASCDTRVHVRAMVELAKDGIKPEAVRRDE
jgi:hypothetical protein